MLGRIYIMSNIQITFRSIEDTQALRDHILKHFHKLNSIYQRINNCHVVVDFIQKNKHQGKLFSVHIDVTTPIKELVVTRKQGENLYVAISEGFNALGKLLTKYVKKKPTHIDKFAFTKAMEVNTSINAA